MKTTLAGAMLAAAIMSAATANADAGIGDAGSLDGSSLALVLGPTFIPTPWPAYLDAVDKVYLPGFTGTTEAVTTPEGLDFGPSIARGEADFVNEVEKLYAAGGFGPGDPLTVSGYSQSTVVESLGEQQLADFGIPSDAIHFVFVGDASSTEGGILTTFGDSALGEDIFDLLGWRNLIDAATPDNLYPTTVYTLTGDGWAQWDNGANIFPGMVFTHGEYFGVTPDELASATLTVDGLTDYFTIPALSLDASIQAFIDNVAALAGL